MKTLTASDYKFLKTKNSIYFPYLISCMDVSGYDIEPQNDKELILSVLKCFKSEYCHEYNLKQYKTYQSILANWFMGLPSACTIDFENYKIIQLCKEWGVLSQDANEKAEDKILENWFNFMASRFIQLCKYHKIDFFEQVKI